ncbi:MAG: hypothetical protein ACI38Q_03195 [Candidatus Bruticola sp.]
MVGYGTTLEGDTPETLLPNDLVTPSETTNRLILLCLKVAQRRADPRALGIVLEAYLKEVVTSRESFKTQTAPIASNSAPAVVQAVTDVISSFQRYIDTLTKIRSWFSSPSNYSLEAAPEQIFDAYADMHNALLAYEWNYLCQGDSPHPAINLMEKVVQATKQGAMDDDRLSEIFDRLWDHFANSLNVFENDNDMTRRSRGISAVRQVMAGIQSMDTYFLQYDLSALDAGFVKFCEGCLLLVELMQDSTGEALADKPTPSPQVNWVIHAARAVLSGLPANILERAQAWFEPQLAESYFRFEQCANQALESSPRLAKQVPVARDGFDRLNRALPLLRLGITRRPLLRKAIQYLEDGAELICQAWKVFTKFEEEANTITCLHCGFENKTYSKVCDRCGARLMMPANFQDDQSSTTVTSYTSSDDQEESDTSDHLSRLIEACDAAKYGRIAKLEFNSVLAWGKQLLRSASSSLSRLPASSDDPAINKALDSLRQGVEEFRQGIEEMQWWADTGANSHLDIASHILLQAYSHFIEVQEMAES